MRLYDAVAVAPRPVDPKPRRVRTDTSDDPPPAAAPSGAPSSGAPTGPASSGRAALGSEPAGSAPTAGADQPSSAGAPGAGPGMSPWVVAAVVVVGIALRLAILLSPLGRPDSDEVIAALMVANIGDDGFPTFFWGQQYGGTIELVGVAASLKVFGWSVGAMRVPTLVLAAVNSVLIWRIGRRWLPERQAQAAGLLVWLGPPAAVWFGVREQLFYSPTITLGLVLGLAAYRVRAAGRARDYLVIGVALGLGIWTSTNIAYFVLPAAVVALGGRPPLTRGRELLLGVPAALVGLVAGAYPYLRAYVETDGAPSRIAEKFPVTGTYWSRFGYFFVEGLPGALGFRAVFTHEWIAGVLGVAAYLAVLGLVAWSLRRSRPRRGGSTMVGWAAIGFLAYPFIYAAIPFVMDDPNLRYTTFVVPFVALVLVRVLDSPRAVIVALALTLVVTGTGLVRLHAISEADGAERRVGNVGDLAPAIAVLRDQGIDAVFGDYWVAYRISFETEEEIIATSSSGIPRYPPYSEHVRGSARSAWVVMQGDQLDQLLRALDGLGVGAEVHPAGELAVVVPDRPVDPLEVPEDARRPA